MLVAPLRLQYSQRQVYIIQALSLQSLAWEAVLFGISTSYRGVS